MTLLFGIPNCDTIKKTQKWLSDNQQDYQFHDFKKDGLTAEQLKQFIQLASWQALVNKRSTTYRNLPDEVKDNLNEQTAFNAMLEQPTLIKRPVLLHNDKAYVGFKPQQYQEIFS